MLRIAFTAGDLLRTKFAPAPAPMMELGLALATMQGHDVVFDRWRLEVQRHLPRVARAMFELVPASGAGPVFLDPVTAGFDDGLAEVMSTPAAVVHAEVRRVCAPPRSVTPWVRAIEERDREAWALLGDAVSGAYDAVLRPIWPQIVAAYQAEVALRSRLLAHAGIQSVLETIYPGSSWQDSTLEIPVPSSLMIRPGGVGVTLLPSVVWAGRPLVSRHPDGSILLIYAASIPVRTAQGPAAGTAVASLLGATRAAVLDSTTRPRTTSEIARELGVSLASASVHAKILRAAGLITTVQAGRAVSHAITPLGAQLLSAG